MNPRTPLSRSESDLGDRVLVPARFFPLLRRALQTEGSPLSANHVLNDTGFGSGPAVFQELVDVLGEDPADRGETRFWKDLSRFFHERGWGRVDSERVHSGLGLLRARDWAESDPEGMDDQPGCHYSSGLLAYVLGRAAGAPIAVLEVGCRSRGDADCAFLYGSEAAIHEVYGLLLDGASLDEALAQL